MKNKAKDFFISQDYCGFIDVKPKDVVKLMADFATSQQLSSERVMDEKYCKYAINFAKTMIGNAKKLTTGNVSHNKNHMIRISHQFKDKFKKIATELNKGKTEEAPSLPCNRPSCINPHEKVYRGCSECKWNLTKGGEK